MTLPTAVTEALEAHRAAVAHEAVCLALVASQEKCDRAGDKLAAAETALIATLITMLSTAYERGMVTADDATFDSTPGAHPAWWRGHYHTAEKMREQLAERMGKPGHTWQALLEEVAELVKR